MTTAEAIASLRRAVARLFRSFALVIDVPVPPAPINPRTMKDAHVCYGVVQDVGGGVVDVWVERDTLALEYPPIGTRVGIWYSAEES